MGNKYFDRWEFFHAVDYLNTNPFEAKTRFEEYISKYPKDYSAYPYYISALITTKQLDQAEKVLNFVIATYKSDKHYNNNSERSIILEKNLLHNKIRLLSYQERYYELHQLCESYSKKIKDMDMNPAIFYSKKKMGLLDSNIRDGNSYLFRQIIKYEESDFLYSVQRHLEQYSKNFNRPVKSIFSSDFPIYKIIEEVKKYIPSDKSLYPNVYDELYVFKYNECGKVNNKFVDYFKVFCFHNTKDIVTIYPSDNCEGLPYIDLNYLVTEDIKPKIKVKSGIERFNQRYSQKKI